MFYLKKPTDATVRAYIEAQRSTNLTYANVGATRLLSEDGAVVDAMARKTMSASAFAGFNVDHSQIVLGRGDEMFERAKRALISWKMFDVGWVDACRGNPTHSHLPDVGMPLALRIRHLGFWSLNAARVVYAFDDGRRFGFAYGTLRDHAECGEEQFYVERDASDDVWFGIHAFSRPRNPLARMGKPLARMLQRRFVHQAMQAMQRATS